MLVAEPGYIYPEAMKIIMLLADLMNGFIYEIGNLVKTDARKVGHVSFILPGIFFSVIAVAYIICCLPCIHRGKKECGGRSICIEGLIKPLISIFSLIGLIFYLVGDNYHLIEQINENKFIITLNNATLKVEILNRINAIQPSFLLLSIVFHRAIPQILLIFVRKLDKHKAEPNDSCFLGIMNTLTLTTELDSWFTMVQGTNNCSTQLRWVWATWVLITAVYATHMGINSCLGKHVHAREHEESDGSYRYCGGCCMIVCIVIAFAFYLLGDNRQPLDCDSSLSTTGRSALKLFFITFAASIYIIVLIVHGIGFCASKELFSEYEELCTCTCCSDCDKTEDETIDKTKDETIDKTIKYRATYTYVYVSSSMYDEETD